MSLKGEDGIALNNRHLNGNPPGERESKLQPRDKPQSPHLLLKKQTTSKGTLFVPVDDQKEQLVHKNTNGGAAPDMYFSNNYSGGGSDTAKQTPATRLSIDDDNDLDKDPR